MSTSSSSSSSEQVEESGNGGSGGAEFEGPSSPRIRRMRTSNGVWPEPFLEALAFQVATNASRTIGRLAAAQALLNLFQVCPTWHAISHSDPLWQNLTRQIWNISHLVRDTWREEYIYLHRTANNFRTRRYVHTVLHFVPTNNNNNNNNDGLSCRRLALSDHHLAAGFADGAVHLFHLPNGSHLSTFYPQHRDRLGRFSSAVSGIILSEGRLVFATLDGDIHVVVINGMTPLRRAHLGDVVNHGALVDFSGCSRWWVGLYAGVPDHTFRIWNSETQELVFTGGTLTNPEAVMGWHLLTEATDLIGRVRVTSHNSAVACTSTRVLVCDLENNGLELGEEEFPSGIIIGLFDANDDSALITDTQGAATLRRVANLEEVCRLTIRGASSQRDILGCVNGGYGVICGTGGVIRVWEIEHGQYLYRYREEVGDCNALIADERYVAACSCDGTIHLWDFGAQ